MEIEVSGSLTKEVPPYLSDQDQATKKVRNRDVELANMTIGLSFKDTLLGKNVQDENFLTPEETNFVIEEADVKVLQDDGLPTFIFSDKA